MFAFPSDMRLSYNSNLQFPLPVFFSFVFTDVKGDHLYTACLQFYEAAPMEDLEDIFQRIYGDSLPLDGPQVLMCSHFFMVV
jgi:uDENN domain